VRPIVDGLEDEWGEQVQVVRLNVLDDDAQDVLAQLGFRFTPTFILLDGSGDEVWRTVGILNAEEVRQEVNSNK
jgi:thiol-disulfide isomerase/thioredoxin